jgi:RNA polymerase sigma-70 factor (ECF subfamily)
MNALRPSADLPNAAPEGQAEPQSGSKPIGVSKQDFANVYASYFKQVWGALRRLGVREADVADVTQKVFLTAYRKLDTFEGRAHVRTWLLGICERTASDYRRSAPVRREVATDVADLELTAPDYPDIAQVLGSRRQLATAEAILDKLPEAQRSVFVLFELEDLSGPEIAELLDISVGTVRSRLRLARESFAREVQRLSAGGRTDLESV